MAESPLSLGYGDLVSELGMFLGFSRTSSNHTADQTTQIEAIIDSGLRRFYQANRSGWSFMRLSSTITWVGGTATYDLADDFGSMIGTFMYPSDTGYAPPQKTSIEDIRAKDGIVNLDGPPTLYAVYPKTWDATNGQRWQATFWPDPDSAYTITYRYNVLPGYRCRAATPYPYGGQDHAETILESCLAVAENRMNHMRGFHSDEYDRLLAMSLERDKMQGADNLGTNADNSDAMGTRIDFDYTPNTVNGVTPT